MKAVKRKSYPDLVVAAKKAFSGSGGFVVWRRGNMWYAKAVITPPIAWMPGLEYHEFCASSKWWAEKTVER